jgi:O-antigen/teichoic acid export membrane protein
MVCITYTPAFQVLQMSNDTKWVNTTFFKGIILFISTALILAPKFGAAGVAMGQLLSSLFMATNTFYRYKKNYNSWPFPTNLNFTKI